MSLLALPLLVGIAAGTATLALAAGGGGGAGGSGAQNAINSGRTMADGQAGPAGSSNNPARTTRARQPTGRAPGR